MKGYIRLLCLAGALTLSLGLSLVACNEQSPEETTPPAETSSSSEALTEGIPSEETTLPEEEPTEPEEVTTLGETKASEETTEEVATSEETTEEVTQAPTLMSRLDLDDLKLEDPTAVVGRSGKCEVSFYTDEVEGKVLRMTTKGIAAPGNDTPYVVLGLRDMVTDMNGLLPSLSSHPHLVLKVRSNGLWSRSLSAFGASTLREAATPAGATVMSRRQEGGDWQYVYLDMSGGFNSAAFLLLNFESFAGKSGESMDLAEIHFFSTAQEAASLCPTVSNTYPVQEQTLEDYTLRVMSFNVQTENGTQVNFDLRADLLRDLMDELRPDSIGMQEVTTGWLRRMDAYGFNDSYAGVGEGRTPGGEASAIYYRKDKFELVDTGTFWLSETPDVSGSALEASLYPRICTWAHLKDRATGFEYIHVNTHLDHLSGTEGRTLRTAQVRIILEYLRSLPDVPMVMTGDFNQAMTTSDGVTYAMYKNILGNSSFKDSKGEAMTGNFSDARAEAADTVAVDQWASMTGYWQEGTEKYNPARKPIDHLFYTTGDFLPMVYRNLLYHKDGVYMSDHLPQYCELRVVIAAEGEGS